MVSRLIDLPFTRGLDESTDETSLAPPGMTELVNYRLTRAGRLEHRLGVTDFSVASSISTATGDRPDTNKPQGIHGRFLAAGGHGYMATLQGDWACVGSVSRFVPTESYEGHQKSAESYSSPSCASVNGYLVVLARKDSNVISQSIRVFDERTGVKVWEETISTAGGTPNSCARVVACGNTAVVVYQDLLTGDISAASMSLASLPLTGFSAGTLITAATASAGFDAAPFDSSAFVISYYDGTNAVIATVAVSGFAVVDSATVTDGAGVKLTTCLAVVTPRNYFLAWLNQTTRSVCLAVFDTNLTQVGATLTMGSVPGTVFSADNFHPVIGRRDSTTVIVGWTDSYLSGTYQTFRTTFRNASTVPALGTTFGPVYGYALASKPFRSSVAFVEGLTQPAVWLVNHNPNTTELDRSYFLMLLGFFSSSSNNAACSLELTAGPSAAVAVTTLLGTQRQVSEVVESTTLGSFHWQTALIEGFRGLGTATPQRKAQVYRFGDASRSFRARTRSIVPCQGSFAVMGGAPRYFDSDRLVEIGMPHGPAVISATPAATGSMAPGDYRYVFTIEYFDGQGQRQLSYVSSPYLVTVGVGQAQVNFELQLPALWALPNATDLDDARQPVLRAYRTSNNGTVYRFAPDTVDPNGALAGLLPARGLVDYQDVNSDMQIGANEAVYVQRGNALSNYRAPPCRFGCEHEGRLVTAGGWNPSEYIVSKLFFAGEGIQFTESASFRDVCPEPITGVASLDGSLVLFAERGIYVVNGDGPTDDGVGSFNKPRRLPGRVGCTDWRSVVTTDAGAWFRSADGMYLLPRGLAAPQFIGAPIKGKLRSCPETLGAVTVTRAVAASVDDCDSEQVIAWLVGDAEEPTAVTIFMFSLATQTWSQVALPSDPTNLQTVIGSWTDFVNGTDVIAFARETLDSTTPGSLLVENPGTDYDQDISDSFEPLLNGSWRTGKVFPFGFGGRGTIRSLRLVGDCLSATTLTPTVYSDANEAGYASSALTFEAGRFAKEIPFRQKDVAWIQIGVADPTTGAGNRGAGLRFNGLALEVEMDPGLIRSQPANRSI